MAQELVVGDVPSVRTGPAEDQQVADPQPVHLLVPGEHVARRAQLADRVDRDVADLGPVVRVRPLSTGSTVNGWLYPQAAGSRKWWVPPRSTANHRPWVRLRSSTSAAYQPASAARYRPSSKTSRAPGGSRPAARSSPVPQRRQVEPVRSPV